MSRRYPGKPPKMKVRGCPAITTWVKHDPHPWATPLGEKWCPGWKGGVRAPVSGNPHP